MNIKDINIFEDLNEVIEERRQKELEEIGYNTHSILEKKDYKYELRAYYLTSCASLRVDKDYIKAKGKRKVDKYLLPYLYIQLKKRYKRISMSDVEFGYYKNDRKVKFESFCV